MRAYILLSGGIDSMACINYYKTLGYDVACIFCNYGQPAASLEAQSAEAISEYFQVPLHMVNTTGLSIPSEGEICGRNALLAMIAFCFAGVGAYKIVLGTHAGTEYADCTQRFLSEITRVFDCYTNGTVIIEAPFITWYKSEIALYCKENCLPYNICYSCEAGTIPPCGHCLSCMDRKEFFYD